MTVRIPADAEVFCPKCQAANHGTAVTVWEVVDERGRHFECDGCARMWLGANEAKLDSKGKPMVTA